MRPALRSPGSTSLKFQSTHSLRSATPVRRRGRPHALRFNPRTPCGVRPLPASSSAKRSSFQSTHSLRSATTRGIRGCWETTGFNPRTPCGVRLTNFSGWEPIKWFQSTHSLRSATPWLSTSSAFRRFQSTHSLRSATYCRQAQRYRHPVSIHALLAECDRALADEYDREYPVSIHALLAECDAFRAAGHRPFPVSIHALLAECDNLSTSALENLSSFNPRTPCGVRLRPTLYIATQQSKSYFAPTSLKRPSLHGCSF